MVAEGWKTSTEIPEKSSPNGRMKRRPKMLQTVFVLTRIAASPPLVTYKNLHDCGFAVAAVRLDEPMYARRSMHEDGSHPTGSMSAIAMICARMQLVVQEEARAYAHLNDTSTSQMANSINSPTRTPSPGSSKSAFLGSVTAELERLYFRLQRECSVRAPNATIRQVLVDTGLSRLFPDVLLRIVPHADDAPLQAAKVSYADYLKHIQHLWQTLSLSRQLQSDTVAGNHKYMAHQIALLYQSLSIANLKLQHLKKRIEPEFEGIKAQTESHSGVSSQLTSAQRQFIMQLTGEVMEAVTDARAEASQHVKDWLEAFDRR